MYKHNLDDSILKSESTSQKSNGLKQDETSGLQPTEADTDHFHNYRDYRGNIDKESDTDSPLHTGNITFSNNGQMSLEKAFNTNANLNSSQALNNSLIDCMSKLTIDASNHPPQICSTLTVTADHPLMSTSSPDSPLDNNFTNFGDDCPYRNTSKNNLYFVENFSTVEGNIFNETSIKYAPETFKSSSPNPDIKETQLSISAGTKNGFHTNRRKIIQCFHDSTYQESKDVGLVFPQKVLGHDVVQSMPTKDAISKYVEERNRKVCLDAEKVFECPITKCALDRDCNSFKAEPNLEPIDPQFEWGPGDFPDSPSLMRRPVFPVELSTIITDEQMSPDSSTCSTEKDISQYCAVVDPLCGQALLLHTPVSATACHNTSSSKRRRVKACIGSSRLSTSPLKFVEPARSLSECPSLQEDRVSLQGEGMWDEAQHQRKGSDTDTEEYIQSLRDSELSGSESLTSEHIPEYSAQEERREQRHWMKVQLPGGEYRSIDMKVIEPYKRVISHGGYTTSHEAIIVFSACFLPDNARVDYNYVMDNLFLYVLSTLENLVTDDYIVVYLHGSAERHRLPTFHWLRKCYQLVDRRLRKSLKHIYLVHPTFWLKSIMWMCRPFISSKVSGKLSYVSSLQELCSKVPVQPAAIPDAVRHYDLNKPSRL